MIRKLCQCDSAVTNPPLLTVARKAMLAGSLEKEVKRRLVELIAKKMLSASCTEDHFEMLLDANKLGDETL